ncbi:MAG: hypothetical protein JXP73_18910 [Deltaproteobacteria bacterium]|nr:hypothetical protein [Deltaproteobacteria bacterium]
MSRKRPSAARLAVGVAPACLLFLALVGAAGCESYATWVDVPIDCEAEAGYEIHVIFAFEQTGGGSFWTAGDGALNEDGTLTEKTTATVETIPDGARCGSQYAAHLHSAYNNDWGSLVGFNDFGSLASPSPTWSGGASAYEGMSFWARAPGNTTKGFTLLLNDPNTLFEEDASEKKVSNCDTYNIAGAGDPVPVTMDPGTGQTLSGGTVTRAIYPDECGNSYTVPMLATSEWRFYTVPFTAFHQDAKPNRVPNAVLTKVGPLPGTGLLIDQLKTMILRFPKEATAELWLDNLGFYRKRAM